MECPLWVKSRRVRCNRAGIFYWVNRVGHAQVFNYGKHMMFDMIVPEPAALFKTQSTPASLTGINSQGVLCPLLALSGHALLHCMSPLLTQSGHRPSS